MQMLPKEVISILNFSESYASNKNTIAIMPSNLEKVYQEISMITQSKEIMGLTGITVLIDTPDNYLEEDMYSPIGNPANGYTMQNRLEFLRKNHIDPIDFFPEYDNPTIYSPYFRNQEVIETQNPNKKERETEPVVGINNPTYIHLAKKWSDFCMAQFSVVEPHLFKAFKTSNASLPIYYDKPGRNLWFEWNALSIKKIKVSYSPSQNEDLAVAKAMQSVSPELWRTLWPGADTLPEWVIYLTDKAKIDSDIPILKGLVLDFSSENFSDTKSYLEEFQKLIKTSKR
jgi:hypothetical protein